MSTAKPSDTATPFDARSAGNGSITPPTPELIGSSPAMQEVYALVRQVARSNAAVLLLGETGTGKELIASAIHRLSPRGSGPFVRVNCGALAENLLESELFGHVRGAFTGALSNRIGRFEAAHTGSIFLDEINSTTPMLQIKLLRVLQEREFERVGDTATIRVDTRVIAASNRDLAGEIEAQRFREDLYYRLNVVSVFLPPLRERREDIPLLLRYFMRLYNKQNNREVSEIDPQAVELLCAYSWPGNVRELQNYIERAIVLAPTDAITPELLPEAVRGRRAPRMGRGADFESLAGALVARGMADAGPEAENLHERIVNSVERELIVQVMSQCEGVQTKASSRLGINRNTLHKKLAQYELEE
jgi:DNA-binding NtrC family response regulator